jgi:hypothetical protein
MVAIVLLLCLAVGGLMLVAMLVFPQTRPVALGLILMGVVAALGLAAVVAHRRSVTGAPDAQQVSQGRPSARNLQFNFRYRRRPVPARPVNHSAVLAEVAAEEDFESRPSGSSARESDHAGGAKRGKAWVGSEPTYDGDVHQAAVSSGYFETDKDCTEALEREKIVGAIDEYIDWYLNHSASPHAIRFQATAADVPLVQRLDSEIEQRDFTWGPMRQAHVLLGFDEHFRDHLRRRVRDVGIADRLTKTGVGAGGVLMLLTTLWGCLKLTQVARNKRARIVAAASTSACVLLTATGAIATRLGACW